MTEEVGMDSRQPIAVDLNGSGQMIQNPVASQQPRSLPTRDLRDTTIRLLRAGSHAKTTVGHRQLVTATMLRNGGGRMTTIDMGKSTVLSLTASHNDYTLLLHLLSLSADLNIADVTRRTAPMRACEYGQLQWMNVLAKAGINMMLVDDKRQGMLFYCIAPTKGHYQCTKLRSQLQQCYASRNSDTDVCL